MTSPSRSDVDLLLAHGAFVRSLARRLVADEHKAEDLAQDAFLAALSKGGRNVRSPRAWLAGILANLRRSDARGRARRESRERETARDTAVPSAAATVEAASIGRDLADRVLALEEPFRTTILLRFYEDLPPRAIARRTGVPVRTVNSRLARGLERLRTDLARGGEERSWLAGLALLAKPSGIAGAARDLGTGVLWMNAKQVVAIAAAIAVTAGAFVWIRSGESAPPPPTAARSDVQAPPLESAPANGTALAPGAAEAGSRRSPGAPEARRAEPTAAAAVLPPARHVRGRVFGPDALPRSGVEVAFDCGLSPAPRATSGRGGVFEIEVPPTEGNAPEGTVRAVDPALVNVSVGWVRAGREVEPIVVVAPARDLAGKVVDPSGAPLPGAQLSLAPPADFMRRLDALLDSTSRTDANATSDASGAFALPRSADLPGARILGKLEGFEPASVDVQPGTDLGLLVEMRRRRSEAFEIQGRVLDAESEPVAEAFVSLGEKTAVTDGRGEFRLETTGAPDAVDLVAIHPGFQPGRFRADRDPASGKPVWPDEVVLKLGGLPLSIRGTVVDDAGKPRAGVQVWLEDPTRFGVMGDDDTATVESLIGGPTMDGDNYWRTATANAEGAFEIGGLVDRDYRLGLIDVRTLELAKAGPFAAGARDVRIVFERTAERRLDGKVLSSRGLPVPGVSLDLMRPTFGGISMSLGRGVRVSDANGKFAFEGVRGTGLVVWIRGDDVVPAILPVPDAIGEEGFTVTVAVRCHFKVHLSGALAAADRLRVLDAEGAEMDLMDVTPTGVTTMKHASIVGGLSASLGVAEQAWTLSILKDGTELARRDLHLAPGILNVIEL